MTPKIGTPTAAESESMGHPPDWSRSRWDTHQVGTPTAATHQIGTPTRLAPDWWHQIGTPTSLGESMGHPPGWWGSRRDTHQVGTHRRSRDWQSESMVVLEGHAASEHGSILAAFDSCVRWGTRYRRCRFRAPVGLGSEPMIQMVAVFRQVHSGPLRNVV